MCTWALVRCLQFVRSCHVTCSWEVFFISSLNWHNNVNPDFDYATAGDQYHYPVIVDVRWNTTCNFSCNYCDPSASSKWAQLKQVPFKSGSRPYYEQVCDFIEQHHAHIHEVALVGGEPLLLPENERLLDVIPDTAIVTLIISAANISSVPCFLNGRNESLCKRGI